MLTLSAFCVHAPVIGHSPGSILLNALGATKLSPSPKPAPTPGGVRVLPPKGLNTSIYLDLNHFSRHTAWAHSFMHAYALWLGPVLLAVVFVIAYALAWWRRAPRAATLLVLGGIGTLVALGLNQLIAHGAEELRPYATHPHVLVLVAKTSDYSFPSDHSVVAGGLTTSLLLVVGAAAWRRGTARLGTGSRGRGSAKSAVIWGLAAIDIVLGLFLCFARVYVGAHYPGDVVAGYLFSCSVVIVVSLLRPLAFRLADAVEPTVFGVLLQRPGVA